MTTAATTKCLGCGNPIPADPVMLAGFAWHRACAAAATDPERILAVKQRMRADDRVLCEATEQLVDAARERYPWLSDGKALDLVLRDPARETRWRAVSVDVMPRRLVHAEVDRRMLAHCRDHRLDPVTEAHRALEAVRDESPELVLAYLRS